MNSPYDTDRTFDAAAIEEHNRGVARAVAANRDRVKREVRLESAARYGMGSKS